MNIQNNLSAGLVTPASGYQTGFQPGNKPFAPFNKSPKNFFQKPHVQNQLLPLLESLLSILGSSIGKSPGLISKAPEPITENESGNGNAGFGDQTQVTSSNANGRVTLNDSVSYSESFLKEKFEEFRNSNQYPNVETLDLRTTQWGYSGSGSALTAFYNHVLDNYPHGGGEITTSYANGRLTLNNSASYSDAFLQKAIKSEAFKNSPQYPDIFSADNRPTPWGYSGSSSEIRALYNYVITNYPDGDGREVPNPQPVPPIGVYPTPQPVPPIGVYPTPQPAPPIGIHPQPVPPIGIHPQPVPPIGVYPEPLPFPVFPECLGHISPPTWSPGPYSPLPFVSIAGSDGYGVNHGFFDGNG